MQSIAPLVQKPSPAKRVGEGGTACGGWGSDPYTKEPYPTTEAELREREEREAKAKEERLIAEFTAFVERMRKKSPKTWHFLPIML